MMTDEERNPVRGMTGYARREWRTDAGGMAWELRTLNHRYLDLSLRMPEDFRRLDAEAREVLAARLRRGKVEASLRLLPGDQQNVRLELDQPLLSELLRAVSEVRRQVPDPGSLDAMGVLSWPGVLKAPEMDHEPMLAQCIALLGDTLEELLQARQREGERIRELLLSRAAAIDTIVRTLREHAPAAREALRAKLQSRLQGLSVEIDEGRLEQELAIQLTRLDVDEELDRLDGHLADLRAALADGGPIGRRLDFLMQEFNREANTLGSKSSGGDATRAAVELKVLIEQMREQVQNLE
jgi:uncharacterized protein (TIGR00255 family)